jgi:hypothetical protein
MRIVDRDPDANVKEAENSRIGIGKPIGWSCFVDSETAK